MVLYMSEVDCLLEMVDGLKRAAACAHGMAHYQQNTNWLTIRDKLEITIMAVQDMATNKGMPRQELINNIDERAKNIPKDLNGN